MFRSLLYLLQKRIVDGAGRHAYRACDDLDILRAGMYVGLLERLRSVAFFCGYERSGDLDSRGAQGEGMLYLGGVHNASGDDDRNPGAVGFRPGIRAGDDLPDLQVVGDVKAFFLHALQVFPGKTQMPAGVRTLDDEKIRGPAVMPVPHLQDDACGLFRGDDGRDQGICSFHVFWQVHRKAGAGDDDVRTGGSGCPHIVAVIPGGDHDIKAQQPLAAAVGAGGNGSCLLKFQGHGAQVGLFGVCPEIRFPEADLGRRDDADSAFPGNGSGQPGQADADAHSALDQGKLRCFISDIQSYCIHEKPFRASCAADGRTL